MTDAVTTQAAVFRLSMMRKQHPNLIRAEAQARLELAAAIMALDDIPEGDPTVFQEAIVLDFSRKYLDALINVVRGDEGEENG